MKSWLLIFIISSAFIFQSCTSTKNNSDSSTVRKQNILNVKGTYGTPPRLNNGRVDVDKLLTQLTDLNVNTYNWLIWRGEKDWDDLKSFLPLAKKNNINVWVSLVPFSESKPRAKWSSEPYGTDYFKWAEEIAKLSLKHKNLTALSIDDFVAWNLQFYTPGYTAKMIGKMRGINPRLAFIPCIYYKSIKITDYTKGYIQYFDGILFPYKAELSGRETLKTTGTFAAEVDSVKKHFRNSLPVIVDVYSSAHSKAGTSTPQYVEEMIKLSEKYVDGVLIYTHPDPVADAAKYKVIRQSFGNIKK